jgi:hypothetical protein
LLLFVWPRFEIEDFVVGGIVPEVTIGADVLVSSAGGGFFFSDRRFVRRDRTRPTPVVPWLSLELLFSAAVDPVLVGANPVIDVGAAGSGAGATVTEVSSALDLMITG